MLLFLSVVLTVWAALNGYAVWRLQGLFGIDAVARWIPWCVWAALWASFPASFWLRQTLPALSDLLTVVSTNWLGVVFVLCACFIVVDVATCGGWLFAAHVVKLRTAAALIAAVLSAFGFYQGCREPVLRSEEIELPGLPAKADGLRLVFVSDLHLGLQIGDDWINRVVRQIESERPDLVVIGGDLVDHEVDKVRAMMPALRTLKAPLGVWAVLGNHDAYGGVEASAAIMREAGYRLLRDESAVVVPGLRIAGVDDVGVRGGRKAAETAARLALHDLQRGVEGCVYVSHTPEGMEVASASGAGLMLSGHTHGGQIWPFNYLVQLRFPTLAGRYRFGEMSLLVSRGAGTWGPRMRLWRPGELYIITLRSTVR